MLRLTLFGTPGVAPGNGTSSSRATRGRRLALLALLACNRGRPLRRDRIMALLSPESPTDRARAQLSDDVYIIRSSLGDNVLLSTGDDLELNPAAVSCDVQAFEALLAEGPLEQAVELVTGPLLDGFHLEQSVEFEQWLSAERMRLAGRYAEALESLAGAAEQAADFATAAAWWRRLAAHDPLCGRVTVKLMRALDANGDRAGALRYAQTHTALLRDEFDAAPTPEVLAFAEQLRTQPVTRVVPEPVPAPELFSSAGSTTSGDSPNDTATPHAGIAPVPQRGRQRLVGYALAVVPLLIAIVGARALLRPAPPTPLTPTSIAVLPFANLGTTSDDAYFSDGLAEQIITTLGRVEGLRVAARTSSFRLRDLDLDVRAVADTLGVAYVLEGSVRRDGNRMRITAKVIDAVTGYQLWSAEYDRTPEDLIDVQSEIAAAIADALRLQLKASRATAASRNLQAYELYLRGITLRNTMQRDELDQALTYFDRAIALEPTFALAYAGKASVIAPAVFFGYIPQEQGVSELRVLVDRALELDPTLGEAHTALGIVRLFWDWDWAGAERSLRRAIALNPSDAHAYHHLANYFTVIGEVDSAIAARSRSLELDPLNPRTMAVLGADHLRRGDYERALAMYARTMRHDPVHPILLGTGPMQPAGPGIVRLAQGRHEDAVAEYARIASLRGATPAEVQAMQAGFARGGMPAFWRAWIAMDIRQSGPQRDPMRASRLALLAADTAEALDWLDRAYETRNPGLIYIGSSFAGMEQHPRVAKILSAMKLQGVSSLSSPRAIADTAPTVELRP